MTQLSLHLVTSSALMGLIWMVQVVHYPSFHFIPSSDYVSYAVFHTQRITWVLAPLMIAEMIFTLLMPFEAYRSSWTMTLSIVLVLIIWGSTFFIQVPLHGVLAKSKDVEAINALISSNWIRTIAWSLKTFILAREVFLNYK
jgi:hypothetical protein